jgi:hypothetical protein
VPTRLAAGLGLESDLRFAPLRPGPVEPDFGSPAPSDVSPDLGCERKHRKKGGGCQTAGHFTKSGKTVNGVIVIFPSSIAVLA